MGCCGPSFNKHKKHAKELRQEADQSLSPLDLLKIRLAHGEISLEEYEKIKEVLSK